MIDVVDLQRKVKLDLAGIREFIGKLRRVEIEAGERGFAVAFVSDRRMKELNSYFRGKAGTTDVLSFPYQPDEFLAEHGPAMESMTSQPGPLGNIGFLGDIVISAEQAERQAMENGLALEIEIKQLILHGLLHLLGFDHETDDGEMDARELVLRDQLGISG